MLHGISIEGIGPAEVLLLRPSDVAAYVEGGVCAIGVAGYDVIVEQEPDVAMPLDLEIGRCSMCLATIEGVDLYAIEAPRIATKYPRLTKEHFLSRGTPARVVELSGNVEIAPLVGLADGIVDLVETGETLRRNGLAVAATLFPVTSRLIVNRAALRLRMKTIRTLIDRLGSRPSLEVSA